MEKDIQKHWKELIKVRDSRRSQTMIIDELCDLIKDLDRNIFLPYLIQMMTHIDQRHTSEVFKHLMSPMKQFTYLIDLYLSSNTGGSAVLSEEDWNKITLLLHECEMTYLGDIGFGNYDSNNPDTQQKVSVSLGEFLTYFTNGQLSYDEQVLERFKLNCEGFDSYVIEKFGFSVDDCIKFCTNLKDIINKKYNDSLYYYSHKAEWKKLTETFASRGLEDPKTWWDEPELEMIKNFLSQPGYCFKLSLAEIKNMPLSADIVDNMLSFFQYNTSSGETSRFYADMSQFENTPIIKLSNSYLCPPFRFLIQSCYNRINLYLSQKLENKYTKHKNKTLEKKVIRVFKKLFGNDALFFESYYFDEKKSEQDLLVVFKGYYFIVEIKDSQFRPPFRDPIKAFDRINTDFKKSIQYGYDQCKRMEDKITVGENFKIYNQKTDQLLYEIKPNKIKNIFSIVVTQFKYGGIQTNLENLLTKSPNDPYPWSVAIDDLEAFILVLIKTKRGLAKKSFIEYIENREPFHEHLLCSDELELCGFYINTPEKYKEIADAPEMISTDARMSEIFDAEYGNGLGFNNELDIEFKRQNKTPKYAKQFNFNMISGEDMMNGNF